MLREAINSGSEIGKEVKNIIDKGELVSDDLIIKLVKDKLTSTDWKTIYIRWFS